MGFRHCGSFTFTDAIGRAGGECSEEKLANGEEERSMVEDKI
jgi:hypothetical protein